MSDKTAFEILDSWAEVVKDHAWGDLSEIDSELKRLKSAMTKDVGECRNCRFWDQKMSIAGQCPQVDGTYSMEMGVEQVVSPCGHDGPILFGAMFGCKFFKKVESSDQED